jgi:hypothetical protein
MAFNPLARRNFEAPAASMLPDDFCPMADQCNLRFFIVKRTLQLPLNFMGLLAQAATDASFGCPAAAERATIAAA